MSLHEDFFTNISGMETLQNYILGRKNLHKFEFNISEYNYTKKQSIGRTPNLRLRFGADVNEFSIDVVNIEVYLDEVELHCVSEYSKRHTASIDYHRKLSLEQKIVAALVNWRNYFD